MKRGIKVNALPGNLFRGLGLGLLVAIIGLLGGSLPFGQEWEEDFGLSWLFLLRGPAAPPDEVAIVSIDNESSSRLGLPNNPRKWPRDLHARLLEQLTEQGASVVVFDVMFQEPRDPEKDQALAEAVRRSGNVILFELLEKNTLPIEADEASGSGEITIERRVPPIPPLADAALGLAPFALPRVPIKVSRVWLFKPEAGGAATLPMVALLAHKPETYDRLLELINDLDPGVYRWLGQLPVEWGGRISIQDQIERLRQQFLNNPTLASRLLARLGDMDRDTGKLNRYASAVITAISGPESIYLNYYGPPRTIDTLSYHSVLSGESKRDLDISGRTVFIGASPRIQSGQQDGHYTPYTLPNGLDISGVEIAATAFANLLDQNQIKPLTPVREAVLLLVWGLALGLGLRRFSGGWIPLVATGAAGAYFTLAYIAFVRANIWLPLVIPLLVQLPTATFGAILWRYRGLQRERENIRHAFGMHLPLPVVDQLARGIDDFTATAKHAYGICLATDGEQYTALSERLAPGDLKQFMNRYYDVLFPCVRSRGGVITDVLGDAMLAIWAADNDRPDLRMSACDAALEILEAVDDFNRIAPEYQLPTRMGLHCGEIVLGHVGAVDHYEYRAVGDIVNTASRIESLGKQLGTRLLVSEEVVSDLDGLAVRPLGQFLLKGKTQPLGITELMHQKRWDGIKCETLCRRFSQGLDAFRQGDFNSALECFRAIEHEFGGDGPSAFYRQLCLGYLAEPPTEEWTGIVQLATK